MMAGSKATRSIVAREVVVVALTIRNQPPLPPVQRFVDPKTVVSMHLHPNLVRAS